MSEGPRFFTVEEANALVPALEIELGRVARVRAELGPLIVALGGAEVAMELLQEDAVPPEGSEAGARRLRALAGEITSAVERVNDLGCLVKDLELGLVDFYSLRDGEPVLLCWQFGEPGVTHWHGVEEGFAHRKELEGVEIRPPEYLN